MNQPIAFEPAIIHDLSSAEYHAHPAVSSTKLKKYRLPTAAHAKHEINNPKDETPALLMGKVLHTLLLEPERIDLDYVIEKVKLVDKRSGESKKTWDAMKKHAEANMLSIVPFEIWQRCLGMQASIEANEFWQQVGEHGQKEISIFSQLMSQPVKARYDAMYRTVVLDLKTSRHHLTDRKIGSIIAELGYHISAGMYLEVGQSMGLQVDRFVWVFVESFAPYLCRFIEATPKMLEIGRNEFYSCLEKHRRCTADKYWPGYPQLDENQELPKMDLPDWYQSYEYVPELEEIDE
jgi:hypothetical protein